VLDKIVRVRPDVNKYTTVVPLKKEAKLEKTPPARATKARVTKQGYKF